MIRKLVICDVCDTLYDSNTTFDFLRFFFGKTHSVKNFLLNCFTNHYSPIFIALLVFGKAFKTDVVKKVSLRLLRGERWEDVDREAGQFLQDVLHKKRNANVFEILRHQRAEGSRIVLMSSSIDVVVRHIAKHLGAEFFASQLNVNDGVIVGTLQTDLQGRKHELLAQLRTPDETKLVVITDNFTDLQLLKGADEQFVVIRTSSAKSKWSGIKPHFVHMNVVDP